MRAAAITQYGIRIGTRITYEYIVWLGAVCPRTHCMYSNTNRMVLEYPGTEVSGLHTSHHASATHAAHAACRRARQLDHGGNTTMRDESLARGPSHTTHHASAAHAAHTACGRASYLETTRRCAYGRGAARTTHHASSAAHAATHTCRMRCRRDFIDCTGHQAANRIHVCTHQTRSCSARGRHRHVPSARACLLASCRSLGWS